MIDEHDLQAKSDQMNAVDFVRPMVFRIVRVEYQPKQEQPIRLHFEGYEGRPYKPCKSMLRGLAQVWTMEEQTWNNRLIELYCDPHVKWAGKDAGGIRISAVSGINEPYEFPVSINRSQRQIHTFNVLKDDQPVVKEFIFTHHEAAINEAESNEAIDKIIKTVRAEFGKDAMVKLKDVVVAARAKLEVSELEAGE